MVATTFRGDLVGTATQAIDANQSKLADIANGLGSGAGTGGHSATDTTATNKVTATITKEINQEYFLEVREKLQKHSFIKQEQVIYLLENSLDIVKKQKK
jgi:hypothetical protein